MKILEIKACDECKHKVSYGNSWWCCLSESVIMYTNFIPKWCKLEDSKKKSKKR